MTQIRFASCEGAPRDLGLDQGSAFRDEIRADLLAAGLRAGASLLARLFGRTVDEQDAALARDVTRHFPHLDERLDGLAEGVGCARAAAVGLLARELAASGHAVARVDGKALEMQWQTAPPPTGLVVRSTRPDGGHPNLTVTRPGLVFALAGVNERGLAGVVQLERASARSDSCRAPAALLLEQCIERLDGVEQALEWCERRPGGGTALLLFADATGATGALRIDAAARTRIARPDDAPTAGAGPTLRIDVASRAIAVQGGGVEPQCFRLDSVG